MEFEIRTLAEKPELFDPCVELAIAAWPEFMNHDTVGSQMMTKVSQRFPEYQPLMIEKETGRLLAFGNTIPLLWTQAIEMLPDEGWRWALEQGFQLHESGGKPNLLSALQIVVAPDLLGKGLSSPMVLAMLALARKAGFRGLVAPVRPNQKTKYPLTPFDRYAKWRNEKGEPFDPWVRVHVKIGGEIMRVCSKALQVYGTVSEWESWTGMKFPESGEYVIPFALVPISIDRAADRGIYIEPNLWVWHPAKRP